MKAPKEEKKGIEAGVYNAVCYSVIDVGTSESKFDGKKKRNLVLGWKLLDKHYSDGNNLKIHKTVTFSMNEKATLRRFIQSWFAGQNVDLDDFNFKTLLNRGCSLVVSPNSNGNNTVSNVMPHNTTTMFDDVEIFSLDEFDGENLPALDEWKINMIRESDEYAQIFNQNAGQNPPADVVVDDDVPF